MISIPRDLFYRNLKINYINQIYGTGQLIEDLSWITGIRIEHYFLIDMYAFIEAIDILDGIDVTLDSDLVDPTYKTMDSGKWSYLSYRKGTHHLSGVQALRVARSRHYSSDFDRARRQQRIIEALRQKLNALSILDMKKIFNLIQTLSRYIETDLSAFDMLNYFAAVKDYAVDSQNVLDLSNVLTSTYYYVWLREKGDRKEKTRNGDDELGPYILLPNNEDWNLIRWYVRELVLPSTR